MTTTLLGTRVDITADIRRQIDDMLASALLPVGNEAPPAVHAAVEVEQTTGGEHRAEVTLTLGRSTLRAEATEDSLREALVVVRHVLTRQVRDWSDHRRDDQRQPRQDVPGGQPGEGLASAREADAA